MVGSRVRRLVAAAAEFADDLAAHMEARAAAGQGLGRPLVSESVDAFHVTIEIPECALDVNVIPRRMGATVFVLLRSDSGKRGRAAEAARYQITPRSIRLPAAADLTEVTTRLANGFLTVTAPRRATATSRAE